MKQFKIIRTMRIYTMFVYIYIETCPQSWKPQRFCFQNGPFFRCSFFPISPSADKTIKTRTCLKLGLESFSDTEQQARQRSSLSHQGPSFPCRFLRDICEPSCAISFIWFPGFIIEITFFFVFICFISTSVHDVLDIQFLKGTHMGFKRLSSLPCQTEGLNVASSPADLWDTFKMLGAQETETSPGKHLAWNVFWILLAPCKLILSTMAQGQASRKIANCHPFLYKFPTSASLHRTGTLRHLMLRTSSNHSDRVLMPFIRDFGTLMHFTCPEKSKR